MESGSVCSRCVLPGSTPGIEFDKEGVCNYCRDYVPAEVQGEEKLREILDTYRGKGEKYDCIVGISGGRDSAYLLWKLVHDYDMRVLCTNYRNPFTSEQARQNMKNALEILGVECISWEFPNDIHRRATKKALKAWAHHPSSSMIPIVCAHCKFSWPPFFKIARERKIPLMMIGSNPLETASFKKAGMGGARSYHRLSNLPKVFRKSVGELVANPRYLVSCSPITVAKMYLMSSHSAPYIRWRYGDIPVLRLYDYIKWNEKEVIATITENLRWSKVPEVGSSWRFDCELDYVRRAMYEMTVGVSELRDLFSKMVREGQMTREEALKRLENEDHVPAELVDRVLEDLELTRADLGFGPA